MLEHKAYLIDDIGFEKGLRPIFRMADSREKRQQLESFCDTNASLIKSPYDGIDVGDGWRSVQETETILELADIALTAFYDPADDIGLGYEYSEISERLKPVVAKLGFSPALGNPIEFGSDLFDPGFSGSYIMPCSDVVESVDALMSSNFDALFQMLRKAKNQNRGLYVTF